MRVVPDAIEFDQSSVRNRLCRGAAQIWELTDAFAYRFRNTPTARRGLRTDEAATKLLYLVLNHAQAEWLRPPREWFLAKTQSASNTEFLTLPMAESLIAQTDLYIAQSRRHDPYEEPVRDVILTSRRGTFRYEDVTGLPWIEIDIAADVEGANAEILLRILAIARLGHPALIADAEAARDSKEE